MVDREKVIEAWENVLSRDPLDVPWDLIDETLKLLKEQDQPTRPVYNGRYWECERCKERYKDILAVKEYKHCHGCGRRISWEG